MLTAAAPDLRAAPYAAMVMDARSGEVLHSRNADTRLHPASLTKMMTLYIAFEAVRRGEITMDTKVTVSRKAAAEEPSKLGLRAGQKIALRYLVRAAAVRSANDAATAIAEAISGSEAAFARRMNRTAKALGMTKTTFKNAHGLTEVGHMSTARDMTILGRRVLYDYPQYYNLFSRRSTDAGVKTVKNTNRRLLDAYPGADGIKTGYTRAAGSNLVASAERGSERIIATVFGGQSSSARNARIVELLDMGFQRAPTRVALRKPALPTYEGDGSAGRVVRTVTTIKRSQRPVMRPRGDPPAQLVAEADIMKALKAVQSAAAQTSLAPEPTIKVATAAPTPTPEVQKAPEPEIVTRISTSGGRLWGVNTGRFGSRFEAEQHLLKLALAEMNTLDGSLRKVAERSGGYDANFVGMTQEQADLACRRLAARRMNCFMIVPT
ncbi:MAG: D-alanyl-D-alanine carboxypeptidase family protein [Pseudomonadota bacterium]